MLSINSHILSIPASTGYVERIFSRMANKWSDCRNRCSTELMRSEFLITLNFEQSCSEFYNSALKDKELLCAARSNKKYIWKKNICLFVLRSSRRSFCLFFHLVFVLFLLLFSVHLRRQWEHLNETISPPQRCSSTAFLDTTLTRLASCIN
ncbi:unnamed protein product [Gadus morhua 'NCC']